MVLLHEHYYVPYHPESEHAVRIRTDLEKLKSLLDVQSARMPVIGTFFILTQFESLNRSIY